MDWSTKRTSGWNYGPAGMRHAWITGRLLETCSHERKRHAIIMDHWIQLHTGRSITVTRTKIRHLGFFPHHSFFSLQTTVNVVADRILEESTLLNTLAWPLILRITLVTHLRQILEIGSHRREIQQLHRALIIGNRQPGAALLNSLSGVGVAKNLKEFGWGVGVQSADERSKVAALQLHRLEVVGIA
jgi:hypothetical protein